MGFVFKDSLVFFVIGVFVEFRVRVVVVIRVLYRVRGGFFYRYCIGGFLIIRLIRLFWSYSGCSESSDDVGIVDECFFYGGGRRGWLRLLVRLYVGSELS